MIGGDAELGLLGGNAKMNVRLEYAEHPDERHWDRKEVREQDTPGSPSGAGPFTQVDAGGFDLAVDPEPGASVTGLTQVLYRGLGK